MREHYLRVFKLYDMQSKYVSRTGQYDKGINILIANELHNG